MIHRIYKKTFKILLMASCLLFVSVGHAFDKGLYLTSWTMLFTKQVDYLISQAKATGINTFVIDVDEPHKIYEQNVRKVKQAGLRYVARIVFFPTGGTPDLVKSQAYWDKRWKQAQYAINLGADAIQLDYIRYKASQPKSDQNSKDIYEVIKYFRNKMGPKVKLQLDVFGIASHMHSRYIGQDVALFAHSIDTLCPMVYPSHYEPFKYHSERPYETIYSSLKALKDRIKDTPNVKINAFIEMYNIRYPMSQQHRIDYIYTEMQAAKDAGADGWYAWSANNKYETLFETLRKGGKVLRSGANAGILDYDKSSISSSAGIKKAKAEKAANGDQNNPQAKQPDKKSAVNTAATKFEYIFI